VTLSTLSSSATFSSAAETSKSSFSSLSRGEKRTAHLDLIVGEFDRTPPVLGFPEIGLALETALTDSTPWCDRHALGETHWEDVALDVACGRGPATLVDHLETFGKE